MNVDLRTGDSLAIMKTIPEGSVDLIITSPPYNLGTTTGGGFPDRFGMWKKPSLKDGYETHDDAMETAAYLDWMREVLFHCWLLLSPTGAIFFNYKPRIQAGKLQTPYDFNPGLPIRQIVIWDYRYRINFSPSFFAPTHEWIVVFAKDGFRLKDKSVSAIGDIWHIYYARNNPHPAPFPLEIPDTILDSVDAKVVLDPFVGSGTTGVACVKRGIDFIGIDKSEKYVQMARKRLELAAEGIIEDWYQHFDAECNPVEYNGIESLFV